MWTTKIEAPELRVVAFRLGTDSSPFEEGAYNACSVGQGPPVGYMRQAPTWRGWRLVVTR